MTKRGSHAEQYEVKEAWYDLKPYACEIAGFIRERKNLLGNHSTMYKIYDILYRNIFLGAEGTDKNKNYPYLKELYNIYKSCIIEACLPGYSALLSMDARNASSVLLIPKLKEVMIKQLKSISALENINVNELVDFILKGEAAAFVKLKETTETYREKEEVTDLETGEKLLRFNVRTNVTYRDLVIDPIDPLDLYIDGYDYMKNPKSCPKIVRSYISKRDLLTDKTNYPMLSEQDKQEIIAKAESDKEHANIRTTNGEDYSQSRTAANQIEVLTYLGDYVTTDGKLLTNIKAVVVEDKTGLLEYNGVDSIQLVYGSYFLDRETHRGISPLACVLPIEGLANRCVDLFISNLDNVSNPVLLYTNGSIGSGDLRTYRDTRRLQYNDGIGNKPEFFSPPEISPGGINLLNVILDKQKDTLGLNNYIAGDTSGGVRTAQESQILFNKANARMRVETDAFSYNFLLPLMNSFYSFNRELALSVGEALDPIYENPDLAVTISTGASRADSEGENQKLMEILGMSAISQPIFQWAAESGTMPLAIRYLFSKFGLTDADNILGLMEKPDEVPPIQDDSGGNTGETPQQELLPGADQIMNQINSPDVQDMGQLGDLDINKMMQENIDGGIV